MAFFPWSEPVDVQEGDRICARLQARHVGGDYVWRWDSEVWSKDPQPAPKSQFQQSTLYGQPFTAAKLRKAAGTHVADLAADGHIESFILQSMNGRTANEEIARR